MSLKAAGDLKVSTQTEIQVKWQRSSNKTLFIIISSFSLMIHFFLDILSVSAWKDKAVNQNGTNEK